MNARTQIKPNHLLIFLAVMRLD